MDTQQPKGLGLNPPHKSSLQHGCFLTEQGCARGFQQDLMVCRSRGMPDPATPHASFTPTELQLAAVHHFLYFSCQVYFGAAGKCGFHADPPGISRTQPATPTQLVRTNTSFLFLFFLKKQPVKFTTPNSRKCKPGLILPK